MKPIEIADRLRAIQNEMLALVAEARGLLEPCPREVQERAETLVFKPLEMVLARSGTQLFYHMTQADNAEQFRRASLTGGNTLADIAAAVEALPQAALVEIADEPEPVEPVQRRPAASKAAS